MRATAPRSMKKATEACRAEDAGLFTTRKKPVDSHIEPAGFSAHAMASQEALASLTAQTLNSGILAMGSRAALVKRLAAALA